MRIIAGLYKGRRLRAAPPDGIRPTSDRLKETVFDILAAGVVDSVFLDGYAGMGGIGLEALSRGASEVHFVEQSRKACRFIREALERIGITERFRIHEMNLSKALTLCVRNGVRFDIAFLDPPYDREDLYRRDLESFSELPVLADGGLLIVEHSKRTNFPDRTGGLKQHRHLIQGDSALSFWSRPAIPDPRLVTSPRRLP